MQNEHIIVDIVLVETMEDAHRMPYHACGIFSSSIYIICLDFSPHTYTENEICECDEPTVDERKK